MRIRQFVADMSVEQVLEFYRHTWKDGKKDRPGFKENDFGQWKMITRLQDKYFFSVQVQPGNRASQSWGYLAISNLPQIKKMPRLGSGFPKMAGTHVINDNPSVDAGRKGRTLLMSNGFTVSGNTEYYRGYYGSRGWAKVMDQSLNNGTSHVLLFKHSGQEVAITVHAVSNGAVIVSNESGG